MLKTLYPIVLWKISFYLPSGYFTVVVESAMKDAYVAKWAKIPPKIHDFRIWREISLKKACAERKYG